MSAIICEAPEAVRGQNRGNLRARGRRRASRKSFFTPVSNEVFLTKRLRTKARQILLILELRAGASRIAKLSNREIVALTGYSLRTVERILQQLRKEEYISTEGEKQIRLLHPIPTEHYVQVHESVVHHQQWEDWQKHLLLFLLTQYRGRDWASNQRLYSLNLYGRVGDSVERVCRVPGSTQERRRRFLGFVKQLQHDGVISIVAKATSKQPATCRIHTEQFDAWLPDLNRFHSAALQLTGTSNRKCYHTKRSKTVIGNAAANRSKRSNPVIENAEEPSSQTHVKESKEFETVQKIPESPRSAFGGRGAISSQARVEAPLDVCSSIGEESERSLESESDGYLASFLSEQRHRELTQEVEWHLTGFGLQKSKIAGQELAPIWEAVLLALPSGLEPEDVISAIKSEEFSGLKEKSFGLLLNNKFLTRFTIEIKKEYDKRMASTEKEVDQYKRLVSMLNSSSTSERIQAVDGLSRRVKQKPESLLHIARLASRKNGDTSPEVRKVALEKTELIIMSEKTSQKYCDKIKEVARYRLQDPDGSVREQAQYLCKTLEGE